MDEGGGSLWQNENDWNFDVGWSLGATDEVKLFITKVQNLELHSVLSVFEATSRTFIEFERLPTDWNLKHG